MPDRMTQASATNRAALVAQLYDAWHGHYMLRQLRDGVWCDVRRLERDEALMYRTRQGEALEVIWPRSL